MTNYRIVTYERKWTHYLALELYIRYVKSYLLGVEILSNGNKERLAPDLKTNRLVLNEAWAFYGDNFELEEKKAKKGNENGILYNFLKSLT